MIDDESLKANTNATPQFIGAVTELLWAQIGIIAFLLSFPGNKADEDSQLRWPKTSRASQNMPIAPLSIPTMSCF
jgi:hypothetical protein